MEVQENGRFQKILLPSRYKIICNNHNVLNLLNIQPITIVLHIVGFIITGSLPIILKIHHTQNMALAGCTTLYFSSFTTLSLWRCTTPPLRLQHFQVAPHHSHDATLSSYNSPISSYNSPLYHLVLEMHHHISCS